MNRFGASAVKLAAFGLLALSASAQSPAPRFSAASLYNQGNAYARAGNPGMAVLNYERAQLLAPGDRDIEANLAAVREAQHLSLRPRSWFERVAAMQSPSTATLSGLLGFTLLGAGALARAFVRRRAVLLAIAALGVGLMTITLGQGALLWPALKAGVIIAHEAPVRESPVPMGDALFALQEAETVTVTGEHESFVLIRTQAGRIGWVSATQVARVVPLDAALSR